jgi:hypothetical protein
MDAKRKTIETIKTKTRYMTVSHKDYHNWDANEDRTYRQYRGDKHKEYRPFTETKPREQSAY